jgi:hypothetical protein
VVRGWWFAVRKVKEWKIEVKILIAVSDGPAQAISVSHLISRGHVLKRVSSGIECITSLQEELVDAVILQQGILWGGSDGVVSRMKEIPRLMNIPLVILSSEGLHSYLADFLGNETIPSVSMQFFGSAPFENVFHRLEVATNRIPMNRPIQLRGLQ